MLFRSPAAVNEAAFARAVEEVAASATRLVHAVQVRTPPRNREDEARKAREKSRARFGPAPGLSRDTGSEA